MQVVNEIPLTIRFHLYGYGKEVRDMYPIYARLIFRRSKSELSMKMNATPEDWDFESEMFKQTGPQSRYNNGRLLKNRERVGEIYNELKRETANPSLKDILRVYRKELMERPGMLLLEYFDIYVEGCKKRPRDYGEGVLEHYRKTRRHLQNYMALKGILNISLNHLSRKFIAGFEQYLLSTPIPQKNYPMNSNTAATYMKKLKAVVNHAVRNELILRNPFESFSIPRYKTTKISYLDDGELQLLGSHDLGGNVSLIRVRDFFMFSVYTGLRYSDVSRLKDENVKKDRDGNMWIELEQVKTEELLVVPMLLPAIELYAKYSAHRKKTGFIFPSLCNQKVNTYLKVIGSLVGIRKSLTHKMGRHTFATTITLEKGADLFSVSKLLGHTSIKSTEIYARVTRKKLVNTVQELNQKYGAS